MSLTAEAVSETDIILYLPGPLIPTTPRTLQALQEGLLATFGAQLADMVPAYQSLLLNFHPQHTMAPQERLEHVIAEANTILASPLPATTEANTIVLPVYYGPEAGLDFDWVCTQTGLTETELIALHSGQPYHVFALGFSPGFAFLGQLPDALHLPRRRTPRAQVPQGSLAIANDQTAVYPNTSPGGWHLLGRSPCRLFSIERTPNQLLNVGDTVRFEPISRARFFALGGKL